MKNRGSAIRLFSYCCMLVQFCIPTLTAQTNQSEQDSLQAISYYREAEDLAIQGDYYQAVARIRESLNISLSYDFHVLSAENYRLLVSVSDQLADWENTLRYSLKAAAQFDTVRYFYDEAEVFEMLAGKYSAFGVHDLAADYLLRSFDLLSDDHTSKQAGTAEFLAAELIQAGKADTALGWYRKAKELYRQVGDTAGIISSSYGMAQSFTALNRYDSAVNAYLEIGNILADRESPEEKARLYNNLGYLWFRQGKYDFAYDAFLKALSVVELSPPLSCEKPSVLMNLAICSQNRKQTDEAISYLNEVIESSDDCRQDHEKAAAEHTLALIYNNRNDPYHAGFYCEKCIETAKEAGDFNQLEQCYKTYSELLEDGNDFVQALDFYERHLNLRDSLTMEEKMAGQRQDQLRRTLETTEQQLRLSIADEEVKDLMLKNLRSQAENREKELRLMTSERELERLEKNRLQQAIELDRERYRREMREQEIKTLEQDREIQNLLLIQKDNEEKELQRQNELLESEKRQQQLEADKQREAKKRASWTAGLSILIVLIVLASLISARRRNAVLRQQKQLIEEKNTDLAQKNEEITTQNEQIVLQKSIIEQKNISITDSIQYASRIQQAVLPSREFLGEMGLGHFIFFRPKDIVSGDFYWGDRKGDLISFAAVDCTGHGVPGAFMSMLGSVFLNEIHSAENIEDAAVLLNKLREQVIRALKQKGEAGEAQDGMDIALCMFDRKSKTLSFAGANNPLYLVRKGEMIIYPGDRMPIGIHRSGEKPFTSNSIVLEKGDMVYIFSDGFADQFGGPEGKKLKYKPFQELLLRIAEKPAEVQKRMLEKAFDSWKGLLEQVDDVLVIGVSFSDL